MAPMIMSLRWVAVWVRTEVVVELAGLMRPGSHRGASEVNGPMWPGAGDASDFTGVDCSIRARGAAAPRAPAPRAQCGSERHVRLGASIRAAAASPCAHRVGQVPRGALHARVHRAAPRAARLRALLQRRFPRRARDELLGRGGVALHPEWHPPR